MWATTNSKRSGITYHYTYDLNGDRVAVCNRKIKTTGKPHDIDPGTTEGRRVIGLAKVCPRCEKKASASRPEAEPVAEGTPESDPTVAALIDWGADSEAYNLPRLADIVRGWLADDIDVWSVDGMIDLIASKHVR